jgi:hypothetical protein
LVDDSTELDPALTYLLLVILLGWCYIRGGCNGDDSVDEADGLLEWGISVSIVGGDKEGGLPGGRFCNEGTSAV